MPRKQFRRMEDASDSKGVKLAQLRSKSLARGRSISVRVMSIASKDTSHIRRPPVQAATDEALITDPG